MKTQQQAQEIFDVLVQALIEDTNGYNKRYVTRNLTRVTATLPTPLEHFLQLLEEKMVLENFDRKFFSQVYANIFHTGPIPKNRNHIAMTCQIQVNREPISSVLDFWVDLDSAATQLNTHYNINPPYCFKVKNRARRLKDATGIDESWVGYNESCIVNSVHNPSTTDFFIGCLGSGMISGYALLLAALAVASLITLSTPVIVTAIGVGLLAGAACYSFFKAMDDKNTNKIPMEPNPENIVDIFQEHFAASLGVPEGIRPHDRVEVIDEPNSSVQSSL